MTDKHTNNLQTINSKRQKKKKKGGIKNGQSIMDNEETLAIVGIEQSTNKTRNTKNYNDKQHRYHLNSGCSKGGKYFLLLIRHPLCY